METCKECGNQFEKKTYQQLYCCSDCKNKATRRRHLDKKHQQRLSEFEANKIQTCPVCGKTFERVYGNTWKQQIYCSKSCRNKNEYSSQIKRDVDSKYKDDIRFGGNREYVLRRDNCECQFCRTQEQLIVHHIDGSGSLEQTNNEMDNLITLCRSCHAKLHKLIDGYNGGQNNGEVQT